MAKTEVRAELKLDDLASATLAKVQSGFTKLDGVVLKAGGHVLDFFKQTAAVAVGVNLGNILGGVKDTATAAFRSAAEADVQMRTLTRTMAGLSTTRGKGMGDFRREAEGVYGKLTDIARASGVARSEIVGAFQQAGANTRLTSEQLTDFIAKSSGASRAIGVPVNEMVLGFEQLRKNMVDAGNPMVALVKQANLMRGHSERIAQKMQMMGRGGMIRLAEKALAVMAERAKTIPLTFEEMGNKLSDMRTDVLRLVGTPMLNALRPLFEKFTGWIETNRGAIEQYARTMGEKAGVWIVQAADKAQEAFRYMQTHADEIREAIVSAFERARAIVKWIVEHAKTIAIGYTAAKVAPAAGAIGGGIATFSKALANVAVTGIPSLGVAASGAAAGLTGMAVTLGAFAAAMGGVMLAVDQFRRLMTETAGDQTSDLDARMAALDSYANDFRQWDASTVAAFDDMRAKIVANAQELGQDSRAAGEAVERAYQQHKSLVEATRGMQEAERAVAGSGAVAAQGAGDEALYEAARIQEGAAKAFADSFVAASAAGNTAAVQAGVQILSGSARLKAAIAQSGMMSAEELQKLADALAQGGDQVSDVVKTLREKLGKEGAATEEKGVVPMNVFNGGQTFQIKQDFRDQDPDRIAVAFQRDIARAAENRLQARTSLAFGG